MMNRRGFFAAAFGAVAAALVVKPKAVAEHDLHINLYSGFSRTKPKGIYLHGKPEKYTCKFVLEPVGKEWNGRYRTLESMSYRDGKWVPDESPQDRQRRLAKESVFRCYRL